MGFFIIIFAQLRDTHKLIPTRGFNTPEWADLRFDIDAIFSSHNLEHLYPHEVPQALREFLRVLRPEGFAVITCPDLRSVCQLVAADQLTETAYQSLSIGYTWKVLVATLQAAGFGAIASTARGAPHFDLWAVAS